MVCTGPGCGVHWVWVWCTPGLSGVHWARMFFYTGPGCGVHQAWVCCALDLGVVCIGSGCGVHWATLTTSVHP